MARVWARLTSHRIVQWSLAYAAFAYTVLHTVEMLSHTFEWPVLTMRLTSDALMLGFPVTVLLAWYYHTPHAGHDAEVHAAPPNSIAVLPFLDMSELKDQEYFSDGLSEELIGLLTKIPALHVPARTSSFYFKGKQATIAEIAQALHVAHVLEGSVRKAGDTVRITVQLIRADNGYHLWSENYDRRLDDIFKVQDEIAGAVVHALKVTLLDAQLPARPQTASAEAYQLYLRGRFHWNRRSASDFRKAVGYFEQAIASDPGYALAYSGLADCYGLLPIYDRSASATGLARQAQQAALKALSIDESLAEAHASLGLVSSTLEYDWKTAGEHFQRAIALNSNASTPHQWYGMLLINTGALDAGLAELRRALDSDPLSLPANLCLGIGLNCARRYDEAVAQLQRTLELGKDFADTNYFLYEAYANQGQYEQAIAAYAYQKALENEKEPAVAAIREAFAAQGWPGFLRHRIASAEAQAHPVPEEVASLHARLGDVDGAMAWLEKAYARRSPRLALLKVDPRYDNLRADPRFTGLLGRVNLGGT
jgi:adenylate cyclase